MNTLYNTREILEYLSTEVTIDINKTSRGVLCIMTIDNKPVFIYRGLTIDECIHKLIEVYKDDDYDLKNFIERIIYEDDSSTLRVTTLNKYLDHCGILKGKNKQVRSIMNTLGYNVSVQYIDGRKTEVYQGIGIDLNID